MANPIIPDDDAARERLRAYNRAEYSRQYHIKNREKILARTKEWVANNREKYNAYHRAHRVNSNRREYERQWESKNRDKINAAKRERRTRNKEKTLAEWREEATRRRERLRNAGIPRDRSWEKRNPDKVTARVRAYKAKRKGAAGTFSAADVVHIRKQQRDKCAYCRKSLKGKGQIDHILAVSKGGSNSPKNLQLTCAMCNARKNAKDPIAFAQEIGLLL